MAKAKAKTTAPAAENTTAAPATDTTNATSPEPVQLTVSDLQLLGRIIDLASRRGAFQAAELTQVGEAYNKLAGFLAYVEAAAKANEETTDSAENTEQAAA